MSGAHIEAEGPGRRGPSERERRAGQKQETKHALSATGSGGRTTASILLQLQATAGNVAVTRALGGAAPDAVSVQRGDGTPMSPAHAGGAMGEVDAAFGLGERGFHIVIGPGGKGGHKLTAHGFDIVAYNPSTGELWIVDNKASGGTSTVSTKQATAITVNLRANVDKAINQIHQLPEFPHKKTVLAQLDATRTALAGRRKLPPKVSLIVTNAGGYHSGVSKDLGKLGIKFEDLTGSTTRAARKSDVKKAKAAGVSPGRSTVVPAVGPGNPLTTTPKVPPPVSSSVPTAVSPGRGATTAGAEKAVDPVRARARRAASEVATECKILRGARWLGRTAQILGTIGVIADLFRFTGMASSKLSGGAFIHKQGLRKANEIERGAKKLPGEYDLASERMYNLNAHFWDAMEDRGSALRAAFSLLLLRSDVSILRTDVQRRKDRIEALVRTVEARKKAAEKILEMPGIFGALGGGSGILVEVFAAREDFIQILGRLRGATQVLEAFLPKLDEDLSYLQDWIGALFATALKASSPARSR